MMLRALYDLAQRERLLENPGFEKKKVDFFLTVDDEGRALGLVPTGDKIGRGKEIDVPQIPPNRTIGVSAGFLFDKAEYVLGVGAKASKRLAECAAAFKNLVDAAAHSVSDPGLRAVARFLSRREKEVPSLLPQNPYGSWTGSELIAFRYVADGTLVHDRPAIRAYWAQMRRGKEKQPTGTQFSCLVTGDSTTPLRLHPPIKGIPEAQKRGASLVSFNSDVFESYGLQNGENAPVSQAAAEGYAAALNWLLKGDISSGRRFRYGVPIGKDMVLIFWTREEHKIVDALAALLDGSDAMSGVREMAEISAQIDRAVRSGFPPQLDMTPFYAVTLSGNARVIVRDWIETTAGSVLQSLQCYFMDLQIGEVPACMPLGLLMRALAAPGKERDLSPRLRPSLIRAALCEAPLPRQILMQALQRLRLPPAKDEHGLMQARAALIRAALNRRHREQPLPQLTKEVTVSLDENVTHAPYLLGRLFAVIEDLQRVALGELNATIRDRFFGAASSSPALVFPRLITLSNHHVRKAEYRGKKLEELKGHILDGLGPKPFPRLLDLEDQGLFAIGYYHQREALFRKRKESRTDPTPAAQPRDSEMEPTP